MKMLWFLITLMWLLITLLLLTPPAGGDRGKVDVTLHFDRKLYEECAIAAKSRNETLDQWMMETIENAVSDQKILASMQAVNDDPCAVQVIVLEDKSVLFLFPCRRKDQIAEVLSSFMTTEKPEMKQKVKSMLSEARELGIEITTVHKIYREGE